MNEETKPAPVRITPLTPSRIGASEEVRQVHAATVPDGTTKEMLLDPRFWSLVADSPSTKLHPFDLVQVVHQDTETTYFCELIVTACGKNWAKVEILRYQELDKMDLSVSTVYNGFLVKYGNMHTGYRVIREADRQVVAENFATRNEAFAWLDKNARTIQAA